MTQSYQISATIIFHSEGNLAIPSLGSFLAMVDRARSTGLSVQPQILLDRPTQATAEFVAERRSIVDRLEEVDFGDLAATRNYGVERADGEYLAFFDGDDLWCDDWLVLAHAAARDEPSPGIWHPEFLYYFQEADYDRHSTTDIPKPDAQSFWMRHSASDGPGFDRTKILFNNLWTANVFARKELHLRFPYRHFDRQKGFGVEDWSWNIETLFAGVPHKIVPDSVHLIRQKTLGSLGTRNMEEGLLPFTPEGCSLAFSN